MDPLQRFAELYAEAQRQPCHDPTAMILSTVGADGRPSARVVLLKGADADGLVFYTNTRSRKGQELAGNPNVALTLWWPHIGWQLRVEGTAARVSDAEADAYFAMRPRGSQLGAWASDQSETLSSRSELEQRLDEVTRRYADQTVPRPPHWSGYRVTPTAIEFWRGREDRLHERELYTRAGPGSPWTVRLLNP
jgi:pyridoxamine 5'-phosphate oxidase